MAIFSRTFGTGLLIGAVIAVAVAAAATATAITAPIRRPVPKVREIMAMNKSRF